MIVVEWILAIIVIWYLGFLATTYVVGKLFGDNPKFGHEWLPVEFIAAFWIVAVPLAGPIILLMRSHSWAWKRGINREPDVLNKKTR